LENPFQLKNSDRQTLLSGFSHDRPVIYPRLARG